MTLVNFLTLISLTDEAPLEEVEVSTKELDLNEAFLLEERSTKFYFASFGRDNLFIFFDPTTYKYNTTENMLKKNNIKTKSRNQKKIL